MSSNVATTALDILLVLCLILVDEVFAFVADGVDPRRDFFWPRSKVLGMGFAWSSFIAQESLLEVCRRAGLNKAHALAPDNGVPSSTDLSFSLATDDFMLFYKW